MLTWTIPIGLQEYSCDNNVTVPRSKQKTWFAEIIESNLIRFDNPIAKHIFRH